MDHHDLLFWELILIFVCFKVIVKTDKESVIELTYPGRHFAASFPVKEESKTEVSCGGDFGMTFQEGTRIYTIYCTSETPKH